MLKPPPPTSLVHSVNCFLLAAYVLALAGAAAVPARAQSVTFAPLQTTLPTTGLAHAPGVVVDRAGNIYIADESNQRVVELPAGGGMQTTVGSGLSDPTALAVDEAGDLFIADQGHSRVVEVPAGGGAQLTVGASGLSSPSGVAVDKAGDVFIADYGNTRVVEVPAGGGPQTTVGTGLVGPAGVTVDGAGDIFIADYAGSQVVELPAGGGAQTTVGSGLKMPFSVAVDAAGDVFIADEGNNRVVEVPAGGGAQTTVGSGLSMPYGVAVDGAGDVFIADTFNSRVVEVFFNSVNFGAVNVGSSSTLTLTYNINSSVTLAATPTVVTQGAAGLDFTSTGTPTCSGAQSAPTTCTVAVQFAPLAPGLREGAVLLYDTSGNLQAQTLVYGLGTAPAVAFPGGPISFLVIHTLDFPSGVAVDAKGDIFVAETGGTQVVEFLAGGGQTTLPTSGLSAPYGPAVDGAGDVFIGDSGNNRVVELPAGGGAQITVGASGLMQPAGVAVDGAGDLFIADEFNSRVEELPVVGAQTTVPASGLSFPLGVTVDGTGDIFIASTNNSEVVEVPGVGAQTTLGSGLFNPYGTAVDAAGDVFIADRENSRVVEVPAGCTSSGCQVVVPQFLNGAGGVALDGAGDLFMLDTEDSNLLEAKFSQAPTVSISTPFNMTSSPQTVTLQNIGNQPLSFTNFAASANFAVDAGTTTCSTSSALALGGTCTVGVTCTPTGLGSLSGTLTLTDNALNVTGSTQLVPLSCTGTTEPTTTTLTATPSSSTGGQTVTFTATVSPAPTGASGLGTVTFKANGTTIGTIGLLTASNGVAILNDASLVASGSPYSVIAIYSGATDLASSTSNTVMQMVSVEPTTTALGASNLSPTYGQSVRLTATVSSTNMVTPTGDVIFKNGTASIGTVVLVKSGTGQAQAVLNISSLPVAANSITADYAGSNYMQTSTSSATTVTVSQATSTTAVANSSNPSVYGQTVTFAATVTAEDGGTATGTMTFYENGKSIGTLNLSGGKASLPVTTLTPGSYTITAIYNGSSNVAGSTGTLTGGPQVVGKASTTTAVTSSSLTVTHGTPVTFTATVTATAPSTTVPTGSVVFYDTFNSVTTELGVGSLSGGKATLMHTYTAAQEGMHGITATYTGSAYVNASPASPAISETVD